MATVTRENIGVLNDKLIVTLTKEDYLNNFETSLKKYAKNANIPGFRKGMVPAGLVRKMYGQGVLTEEVVRLAEKQLFDYLETEKLDIFAQPLPVETEQFEIDINNPADYTFAFEVGLKPAIDIDPSKFKVTRYVINVEDKMIDEELERLTRRHGNMTEPETVSDEETVLNISFAEADDKGNKVENGLEAADSLLLKYFKDSYRKNLLGKKKDDVVTTKLNEAFEGKELDFILKDLKLAEEDAAKYFNLTITKLGFVEKAALDEAFFEAAFPGKEVKTVDVAKQIIKEDIAAAYASQSRNQLHDQIYHLLLDHTTIEFPEAFLKRWLQVGGEQKKTAEAAEQEYPSFSNSLKWTLISSKLAADNKIEVLPNDLKAFAINQLLSYMGGTIPDANQQWVEDYANRMMKDKKFVEDSYYRIQTEKMFAALESQVKATEESIAWDVFKEKLHHHHH